MASRRRGARGLTGGDRHPSVGELVEKGDEEAVHASSSLSHVCAFRETPGNLSSLKADATGTITRTAQGSVGSELMAPNVW